MYLLFAHIKVLKIKQFDHYNVIILISVVKFWMNVFAYSIFCAVAGKTKRFSPNTLILKLLEGMLVSDSSDKFDVSWVALIVQTYKL